MNFHRTLVVAGLLTVSQATIITQVEAATDLNTKLRLSTSLERRQNSIRSTGEERRTSISSLFSSIRKKFAEPVNSKSQDSTLIKTSKDMSKGQIGKSAFTYSSSDAREQHPIPVPTQVASVRSQIVSPQTQKAFAGTLINEKSSVTYHIVQPGESLSSISREHYGNAGSWKVLAKENGIGDSSSISVGTRLYIPQDPKNPSKGKLETLPITATAPVHYQNRYTAPSEQPLDYAKYVWKVYQARAGDTLSSLANKFLGDSAKSTVLAQYNKLPVNTALPVNYTLLVPQEKKTAITERYILSTQGVFR